MARLLNLSRPQSGFLTDDYLARWIDPQASPPHKLRRNKSRLGSIANAQCAKDGCRMAACPSCEFQPARYVFIGHAQGQSENYFCLGVNLTVSNSLAGGEIWLSPS